MGPSRGRRNVCSRRSENNWASLLLGLPNRNTANTQLCGRAHKTSNCESWGGPSYSPDSLDWRARSERKDMLKAVRIFFASLLVVLLVVLTGISAIGGVGIASFFQPQSVALVSQPVQAATPATATITTPSVNQTLDTQSPPAQAGVIDARTAVRAS